jgi:hypothetical protein
MTTFIREILSAALLTEWELTAEVDWNYRMLWRGRLSQKGFKDLRCGFSVPFTFSRLPSFGSEISPKFLRFFF